MPRMDEILERKGKANFISCLDLTKGYWQVLLSKSARDKTAFISPFGLFEYLVMPFGMRTAPATFMRLMDKLLEGEEEHADAYYDDASVFSDDWEQHLKHLRSVLERMRNAGLTLRPTKCYIGHREIPLVGHIVGGGQKS